MTTIQLLSTIDQGITTIASTICSHSSVLKDGVGMTGDTISLPAPTMAIVLCTDWMTRESGGGDDGDEGGGEHGADGDADASLVKELTKDASKFAAVVKLSDFLMLDRLLMHILIPAFAPGDGSPECARVMDACAKDVPSLPTLLGTRCT